jgi:WD40 repeat protein
LSGGGEPRTIASLSSVVRLDFHPDGTQLAAARETPSEVVIIDVGTGQAIQKLPHASAPRDVAWQPAGQLIAVASGQSIHVWEASTGDRMAELEGHQNVVERVIFNQFGDLIAGFGWDNRVCLWHPPVRFPLVTAPGRNWIQFSEDDRWLAGADADGEVGIWEVAHGSELRSLHSRICDAAQYASHPDKGTYCVAFHPGGSLLASGHVDGVRFWTPETSGEPLAFLPLPYVSACFFHTDPRMFVTGSQSGVTGWPIEIGDDGSLRLGPPQWLDALGTGATYRCRRLGICGDGSLLAAVLNPEAEAMLFDLRSPGRRIKLDGSIDGDAIAVSRDRQWVATGSWNPSSSSSSNVRIWRSDGQLVKELPIGDAFVEFQPSGEWLLAGSEQEYCLWRVGTWERGPNLRRSGACNRGPLAFTEDGTVAAIASTTHEVQLVEVPTLRPLATLSVPRSLKAPIVGLCFGPDNRRLAAACQGNVIQVWDLAKLWKQLEELHLRPSSLVRFLPRNTPAVVPVKFANAREAESTSSSMFPMFRQDF